MRSHAWPMLAKRASVSCPIRRAATCLIAAQTYCDRVMRGWVRGNGTDDIISSPDGECHAIPHEVRFGKEGDVGG